VKGMCTKCERKKESPGYVSLCWGQIFVVHEHISANNRKLRKLICFVVSHTNWFLIFPRSCEAFNDIREGLARLPTWKKSSTSVSLHLCLSLSLSLSLSLYLALSHSLSLSLSLSLYVSLSLCLSLSLYICFTLCLSRTRFASLHVSLHLSESLSV